MAMSVSGSSASGRGLWVPDAKKVMTLEKYPQKTLRECSKTDDKDDPGFADDEHLAVDFDAYIGVVCDQLRAQCKKQGITQQPHMPIQDKPSTADALILCGGDDGGDDVAGITLIEFKNRNLFKRGRGGQGIADPLEIKPDITIDLISKLYDSAIMLLMLERVTVLTARRMLTAYIVCSSTKNEEFAGRVAAEAETVAAAGGSGFAAYSSIMADDAVAGGLFDATVFSFKPKWVKHFESYLYSTVCFITEEQVPTLMSTIRNVHPVSGVKRGNRAGNRRTS